MTVQMTAFDPDGNGIGILSDLYTRTKFSSFDNVAGVLSGDNDTTQYAFIGPDGGGIVFHSADGWTTDPDTGKLIGTIDSISFGQQTNSAVDGTYQQAVELKITGLDLSATDDLDALFAMASNGDFGSFRAKSIDSLYSILDSEGRIVSGSQSQDSLVGSSLDDIIRGGDGDDRIYGVDGNDRLIGGNGNDKIVFGFGDSIVYGGAGNDQVSGRTYGNVVVKAGIGDDNIVGGRFDDVLYGEAGNDSLAGGSGRDKLYGGHGDDILHGGRGIDTFVFQSDAGNDTLRGFGQGKVAKDVIVFDDVGLNSFQDVLDHAEQVGRDVLITYDEGSLLITYNNLADFDRHDFSFA